MPWFWDVVQLSTQIPLQLPVSTTLLNQSHNYVFHSNPQHRSLHAWCLGVDSSKNKASLWRWQRELLPVKDHQQGPSTSQSGPYLKNGAEKIWWTSPGSPGWQGMPWFWDLVQLSTEIPLQLPVSTTLLKQSHNCVSQQSTTSQPPCLVSRSGQLQEQGFSVEVAERIAAHQKSSTRTIYKSNWALFEKNSADFSTPSVKQVSDFFMYLYQDLNRRPSTTDGYRTAIVDTLGPAGHHIYQSSDLNRLLSSFHRDRPKSFRNLPKWNLSVVFNELTKAPFGL